MAAPPSRDEDSTGSTSSSTPEAELGLAGRRGLAQLLSTAFGHPETTETFGRYQIGRRLGSGAFGEVYEAIDPRLGRKVALKLLHRGATHTNIERLRREARAMAQVQHPALVGVYEVDQADDRDFIAMELVVGTTLADWAQDHSPSARGRWKKALRLLVAAGQGLAAAHAQGLIHRDFKPANVLVGDDGQAKVADFGLARMGSTETSQEVVTAPRNLNESAPLGEGALTRTGAILGTPRYMSPEQHLGRRVDAHSDQFSFGVTAFSVLHGHAPFAGETLTAILDSIEEQRFTPPAVPEVPRAVNAVLRRAMALHPRDRYRSMDALLEALKQASAPRPVWPWVIVGSASALVLTLGLMSKPDAATHPPCDLDTAREQAATAWNPSRRKAVVEALEATGVPYAEATVRTIDQNLDARTKQWAQARAHACQATWVEQSASEAVFDRRVACLRDDLAGTDALVTRLESATPALAERAVSAVTRLPAPGRCTQPGRAAQDETPEVEGLRQRLANARAAHLLAEYPKARREAEAIANDAEQAGLLSLRGDALELWAKAQSSIEPASSGPQITAAFEIAVQLDESEAATERALSAASMLVDEHPEEGEQWMRHAHAALDRVTDPDFELRARAEKVQCLVSGTLGRFEEALGHCERAMELVDQAPESATDARWGVTMTTANALRDLGREKEAVVLLEQLRAEAIERNGANHPRVGGTTLNLGNSAKVNGDVARAVRLYQEAEKIFSVAYRPDHPWVVSSLLNRGGAELSRRNPEEAAKVFTRALELCGDREDSRMIRVMRMLAEARRHQGRYDVALELLTRVTDLEDELLPADHPHRSFTHHNRGMIYLRQGRLEEARKDFERSLHFHAGAPNTARAAQSHAELAKVAMLEKRFSDAELSISRAVEIHRSVASSPTDKAAIFIRQAEILIELEQFEAAQQSLDAAAPLIEQAEPELQQDLPEALIEVSARIPPRVQNAKASGVQ